MRERLERTAGAILTRPWATDDGFSSVVGPSSGPLLVLPMWTHMSSCGIEDLTPWFGMVLTSSR